MCFNLFIISNFIILYRLDAHNLYRFNSDHNGRVSEFLFSQLKKEEFTNPHDDRTLKRKPTVKFYAEQVYRCCHIHRCYS